jgi:hypothetical protein
VADDPIDAFDALADDIRRRQDELDAADRLRSERAEERRKPMPPDPPAADAEPPESK